MSTKKVVYYMRHFEALHNIPPYNYDLRDPALSPRGHTQATASIESIQKIPKIDLIVCSPLTRTLQTYLLVFNNQRNLPLIIHPDLQEKCANPCDVGSPINELTSKFSDLVNELNAFDQTFGDSGWLDKSSLESIYSANRVKERAKRFVQWVMNRSEENIFVISHNLMIQEILQLTHPNEKNELQNGEIRTVEYQC